jgi:deoxyadenosine/deoxycytidine kinase
MTETTVSEPAKPSHVQIDPMAAASEAMALNEFYKNRCLLLANEIAGMRAQMAILEAQSEAFRTELEQRNKDLEAAQKAKRSA